MDHCCKKKWYESRLLHVITLLAILLISAQYISFLEPFQAAFFEYVELIWWAIVLGLIIGGIIDHFIPEEYIAKHLSKNRKRTIINAALFGFLMSACSHGILAIAIQLYKKGASIPAVIAFLMAAPWANLTITIMLFGFFGVKALVLVVCALLIAIVTGFCYQILDSRNLIEKAKKVTVDKGFSMSRDIKIRWKKYRFTQASLRSDIQGVYRGTISLGNMVLTWIIFGMVLAAAARAYVPVHIFHQYLGPTILGLLVTVVIATLIEVCSEGTSPLAFEIYNQTGAFGNSFVFLMAGVATDYTEIGLLWSNIGKKTALWLPIVTVPQIIIIGIVFNVLF